MTSPMNLNEIPNLLELVEASRDGANVSRPGDLSSCGDKVQSICADEAPPQHSVCGDEVESDIRLKTDIEQVGSTVYGLPLYHFRYKSGTKRFAGVMAQDVLEVMPDAVSVGEDGFYRVNYARLGIKMTEA